MAPAGERAQDALSSLRHRLDVPRSTTRLAAHIARQLEPSATMKQVRQWADELQYSEVPDDRTWFWQLLDCKPDDHMADEDDEALLNEAKQGHWPQELVFVWAHCHTRAHDTELPIPGVRVSIQPPPSWPATLKLDVPWQEHMSKSIYDHGDAVYSKCSEYDMTAQRLRLLLTLLLKKTRAEDQVQRVQAASTVFLNTRPAIREWEFDPDSISLILHVVAFAGGDSSWSSELAPLPRAISRAALQYTLYNDRAVEDKKLTSRLVDIYEMIVRGHVCHYWEQAACKDWVHWNAVKESAAQVLEKYPFATAETFGESALGGVSAEVRLIAEANLPQITLNNEEDERIQDLLSLAGSSEPVEEGLIHHPAYVKLMLSSPETTNTITEWCEYLEPVLEHIGSATADTFTVALKRAVKTGRNYISRDELLEKMKASNLFEKILAPWNTVKLKTDRNQLVKDFRKVQRANALYATLEAMDVVAYPGHLLCLNRHNWTMLDYSTADRLGKRTHMGLPRAMWSLLHTNDIPISEFLGHLQGMLLSLDLCLADGGFIKEVKAAWAVLDQDTSSSTEARIQQEKQSVAWKALCEGIASVITTRGHRRPTTPIIFNGEQSGGPKLEVLQKEIRFECLSMGESFGLCRGPGGRMNLLLPLVPEPEELKAALPYKMHRYLQIHLGSEPDAIHVAAACLRNTYVTGQEALFAIFADASDPRALLEKTVRTIYGLNTAEAIDDMVITGEQVLRALGDHGTRPFRGSIIENQLLKLGQQYGEAALASAVFNGVLVDRSITQIQLEDDNWYHDSDAGKMEWELHSHSWRKQYRDYSSYIVNAEQLEPCTNDGVKLVGDAPPYVWAAYSQCIRDIVCLFKTVIGNFCLGTSHAAAQTIVHCLRVVLIMRPRGPLQDEHDTIRALGLLSAILWDRPDLLNGLVLYLSAEAHDPDAAAALKVIAESVRDARPRGVRNEPIPDTFVDRLRELTEKLLQTVLTRYLTWAKVAGPFLREQVSVTSLEEWPRVGKSISGNVLNAWEGRDQALVLGCWPLPVAKTTSRLGQDVAYGDCVRSFSSVIFLMKEDTRKQTLSFPPILIAVHRKETSGPEERLPIFERVKDAFRKTDGKIWPHAMPAYDDKILKKIAAHIKSSKAGLSDTCTALDFLNALIAAKEVGEIGEEWKMCVPYRAWEECISHYLSDLEIALLQRATYGKADIPAKHNIGKTHYYRNFEQLRREGISLSGVCEAVTQFFGQGGMIHDQGFWQPLLKPGRDLDLLWTGEVADAVADEVSQSLTFWRGGGGSACTGEPVHESVLLRFGDCSKIVRYVLVKLLIRDCYRHVGGASYGYMREEPTVKAIAARQNWMDNNFADGMQYTLQLLQILQFDHDKFEHDEEYEASMVKMLRELNVTSVPISKRRFEAKKREQELLGDAPPAGSDQASTGSIGAVPGQLQDGGKSPIVDFNDFLHPEFLQQASGIGEAVDQGGQTGSGLSESRVEDVDMDEIEEIEEIPQRDIESDSGLSDFAQGSRTRIALRNLKKMHTTILSKAGAPIPQTLQHILSEEMTHFRSDCRTHSVKVEQSFCYYFVKLANWLNTHDGYSIVFPESWKSAEDFSDEIEAPGYLLDQERDWPAALKRETKKWPPAMDFAEDTPAPLPKPRAASPVFGPEVFDTHSRDIGQFSAGHRHVRYTEVWHDELMVLIYRHQRGWHRDDDSSKECENQLRQLVKTYNERIWRGEGEVITLPF